MSHEKLQQQLVGPGENKNLILENKLAVDKEFISTKNHAKSESEQYRRAWENTETSSGKHYCPICGEEIAQGTPASSSELEPGEIHHLIKQRYFPSPYEVNKNKYSKEEEKSRHHLSNLLPVCGTCHYLIEGFENGRPHIMSWLCSSITGQEIPLVLPANSISSPAQRRNWSRIQRKIEYLHDSRCMCCGSTQSRDVAKSIALGPEGEINYIGKTVRVVHVIPPTVVPELMHHPDNLILLCLDCLFDRPEGSKNRSVNQYEWRKKEPIYWVREFKPHLVTTS
jgi:hypothetical protein